MVSAYLLHFGSFKFENSVLKYISTSFVYTAIKYQYETPLTNRLFEMIILFSVANPDPEVKSCGRVQYVFCPSFLLPPPARN
jgi:hypothetical protein